MTKKDNEEKIPQANISIRDSLKPSNQETIMAEQIISKKCSKCKEIKPVSEFHKLCRSKDGFRAECKICHYREVAEYRKTLRGRIFANQASRKYRKSEKGRATQKRYRQSEKGRASRKRYSQTEKGRITRERYLNWLAERSKKMKSSKSKSKIYVKHVPKVRPEMSIFTPEQLKTILEYVQMNAKDHPRKRTKETELMVLILHRGLSGKELLDLNIEDMPCDGRSTIIVHNRLDTKTREVYLLDDSLGTKINKYVQKDRQGAEPKDPLFINKNGIRTTYHTLYGKLLEPKYGLSEKLGIKPFTISMFRRTAEYQLAGERNEENKLKSKEKRWQTDYRPQYMAATEAIKVAQTFGRKLSYSQLSKILKPDGPIRYMRKEKPGRCKVHVRDFMEYIKTLPYIKPQGAQIPDEIIDEYLANKKAVQAELRG